jgi:hypothetical protein
MKASKNGYTNGRKGIGQTNGKPFPAVSLTGTQGGKKANGKIADKTGAKEALEEYRNGGILLLALSMAVFFATFNSWPNIAMLYMSLTIIGAVLVVSFHIKLARLGKPLSEVNTSQSHTAESGNGSPGSGGMANLSQQHTPNSEVDAAAHPARAGTISEP